MQKQKIRVQCTETVSRRTSALMGAHRGDTKQTAVEPFPGEVALSEGKTPVSSGHSSPGVVNLSSRQISSQFVRGNCNKLCLRLLALKQALSQNIATKTSLLRRLQAQTQPSLINKKKLAQTLPNATPSICNTRPFSKTFLTFEPIMRF